MPSRKPPPPIATHALDQTAPPVQVHWINTIDGRERDRPDPFKTPDDIHRHDFYELIWFRRLRGSALHRVDLVEHHIRAGDLFLIAPEQIHYVNGLSVTPVDFCILMIRCEYLAALDAVEVVEPLFHDPERAQPLRIAGAAARKLSLLLGELSEELEGRGAAAEKATSALLHLLFVHLLRETRARALYAEAVPSHVTRFAAFRRLLEEHYREAPTVSDLARRLGLSERQLNRVCKEVSGRPAHQLIRERVGLEACRLLCNSSQSVKEIAFALGFSDPGYFSRFFQALYECSPAAFRALMSGKYKQQAVSSMGRSPAVT